jgi:hypothetical protein
MEVVVVASDAVVVAEDVVEASVAVLVVDTSWVTGT